MSGISRRDFLKIAGTAILTACGLLGLGGLIRFLDTQTDPVPPTDFDLGPASNYAVSSRTLRPEIPAIVLRTTSGFTALNLVCTHLGCTVESKPEGFTCPCHGSRFDPQGKITRGPAQKPLNSLRTGITSDGKLHIYTN
jgi:nitrite reductase/ring-hydroxylating ferredoxin subunit